jgi:hypothetical protein
MKPFLSAALLFCVSSFQVIYAQTPSIDRSDFLNDTSVINATITTNLNKLLSHGKKGFLMPAIFSTTLADSTKVNDPILLEERGHFRHDYCYVPPLKVIFKYKKPSVLYSLKSLKLVSECKLSKVHDQYLLKEFIVYKIYNLITDMSFHVRLLNLNFVDSAGKKKTITEHAFLMEDIKDLAKRNQCIEFTNGKVGTESTNRNQMTIVALFEYMIGNTDWAVSVNHNIKLIISKRDSLTKPYTVAYDFDYSGFVNTDYAVPDEKLEIENVQQRLYRGFPRTMEELNEALDIFKKQKEKIYATINNFDLLNSKSKSDLIGYLDDFYKTISRQDDIKSTFIDNARSH